MKDAIKIFIILALALSVIQGAIYAFASEVADEWPYENNIVIKQTNGIIVDARIARVGKEDIVVEYPIEGGGSIEQDLKREKIEYLIFRPVNNQESNMTRGSLKMLFPKMQFYNEGNFTIVTDSYITWVKNYRSILRQTYTDIYLNFFELFKDKKPQFQNFVVVFDNYDAFTAHALADNIPAWSVMGYFNPKRRVLYLFNSLGDEFAGLIFEIMVGVPVRIIDGQVYQLKKGASGSQEMVLEGLADDIKDKYWRSYNVIKGEFREKTESTLRHEFTHELFACWGMQNIIVSKAGRAIDRFVEKKKDFFETKDLFKKRRLLMDIITLKRGEEPLNLQAANSWFVEGAATYCETYPIGKQNDKWLFIFQEMKKNGMVYPLEQLTVYKMGSFPGVYPKAMIYAYAQSWAFFTFLMDRYPDEFMEYQKKMSTMRAEEQDDIKWLLEVLGKDSKALQDEFLQYMDKYEQLEDPFVKRFETLHTILTE